MRILIFLVVSLSGMEAPPESIQLMWAKLAQTQEEQKKESEALKKVLEESSHDKISQLLKGMQILTQEYNIHNKTLQNLESSCAKLLSKKSNNHEGILKRLEKEVKQLNDSYKELYEGINASQFSVASCKALIESQSRILDNLGQQMNLYTSSLGLIITILQTVETATLDIKARLDNLPVVNSVAGEPLAQVQPLNNEVTLNPMYLMQDLAVFTQEPQT